MQATRQGILDYLHRYAEATVRQLGDHLRLTSTGVRQHLGILEREHLVEADEARGRVGRPALVYRLTDRGQQLYPKQYDTLTNAILDEVKTKAGSAALLTVLRGAAARMADAHASRLEGRDFGERVKETVRIMRDQGLIVEIEDQGDGSFLIHECTCPYPTVARRHPGVCALEVDLVCRLSGGDARLTSSLLRGDRACTYRIRPRP